MSSMPLLFDQMPVDTFLREYWQKKPCLFKQALPGIVSPLTPDELAGLALEDDIESRLIIEHGTGHNQSPWELRRGPFTERDFACLPDTHWTLLVQAVDQWVPEVKDLLKSFQCLPQWRLDDIMISFAPEGGSVGPHFDQYDVFLVQVDGTRHWDLGTACNHLSALNTETELKILTDMAVTEGWDITPGDVLYVPPSVAHHGVALDNCLTYSIGFRAPDAVEMLQGLAQRLDIEPDVDFMRYQDADLSAEEAGHAITPQALERMRAVMTKAMARDDVLADWLGAFMTQNKYDLFDWDDVEEGNLELSPTQFVQKALPTRIAWFGERLYVNGRAFLLTTEDQPLMASLAHNQSWTWQSLTDLAASEQALEVLDLLILSGSLELPEEDAFAAPVTVN